MAPKQIDSLGWFRIEFSGVVQGVGFRPFVKRIADQRGLRGVVYNTTAGVAIEVKAESEGAALCFADTIRDGAPRAARIESCRVAVVAERPATGPAFQILESSRQQLGFTLVPADLATCSECLSEVLDVSQRRGGYAFTNCTNCGPRYSITKQLPYDRANTTMSVFRMCAQCAAEYADPADRRFHAEPIACPACGPQLLLNGTPTSIDQALAQLAAGRILAIKGIGGYQLACDAFNTDAVNRLRQRKRRGRKPFALMMRDLETVARYCVVDRLETSVLCGPEAPIVLLPLRERGVFSLGIVSGLGEIGVMLPYTPLHHLLLRGSISCLVMTSGNISEEPIVTDNLDAAQRLSGIADSILSHNRDIFMRVDDSVVRVFEDRPRLVRRARGYAPNALRLATVCPDVLAVGAELKNTFCLIHGNHAILSQHIGDLENLETMQFFDETLNNFQQTYGIRPQIIAHDLHPDYLSTRWAMEHPEQRVPVQHHHAHIASCMAENGIDGQVIGVAFDGAGYGTDGQVWGGEFLVCDYAGFERVAHLRYVPLPGGDRAAREPFRMAAAHLYDALGPARHEMDLPSWRAMSTAQKSVIKRLVENPGIHTSSCGRLFDAVASICGISQENSYEGESAMLLEAAAAEADCGAYQIGMHTAVTPWQLDTRGMIAEIAKDVAGGCLPSVISARFHEGLAEMISAVCTRLRHRTSLRRVCLSGGTFQNTTLLRKTLKLLREAELEVLTHSTVPANDGGLSLGQALIAAASPAGLQ
jgi:hydrogenase maturation protein HypF